MRLSDELANIQSKYNELENNYEETKRNLDISHNENAKNILKIQELIKEKIKLTNELNQTIHYHQEPELESKGNPLTTSLQDSPVLHELNTNEESIKERLRGILTKCIYTDN